MNSVERLQWLRIIFFNVTVMSFADVIQVLDNGIRLFGNDCMTAKDAKEYAAEFNKIIPYLPHNYRKCRARALDNHSIIVEGVESIANENVIEKDIDTAYAKYKDAASIA